MHLVPDRLHVDLSFAAELLVALAQAVARFHGGLCRCLRDICHVARVRRRSRGEKESVMERALGPLPANEESTALFGCCWLLSTPCVSTERFDDKAMMGNAGCLVCILHMSSLIACPNRSFVLPFIHHKTLPNPSSPLPLLLPPPAPSSPSFPQYLSSSPLLQASMPLDHLRLQSSTRLLPVAPVGRSSGGTAASALVLLPCPYL